MVQGNSGSVSLLRCESSLGRRDSHEHSSVLVLSLRKPRLLRSTSYGSKLGRASSALWPPGRNDRPADQRGRTADQGRVALQRRADSRGGRKRSWARSETLRRTRQDVRLRAARRHRRIRRYGVGHSRPDNARRTAWQWKSKFQLVSPSRHLAAIRRRSFRGRFHGVV